MTRTVREKRKLLARVRRIRGQVEAIEQALEVEAGCKHVLRLVACLHGGIPAPSMPRLQHSSWLRFVLFEVRACR